jgi:predicted extracellular nuclease
MAQALADWLETDPTHSGDPDFLITGDLNAYAMEDPITTLETKGYADLVEQYLGTDAYSYVFFGQAGYLDHALASGPMAGQVAGTSIWHINADEPSVLDYNTEFKSAGQIISLYAADEYRSSDDDPVIVELELGAEQIYLPVVMR